MTFDTTTRKLTSDTGYIHKLDDSLYTDHFIYLGIYDNEDNYEEGSKKGYQSWLKKQEEQEKTEDK